MKKRLLRAAAALVLAASMLTASVSAAVVPENNVLFTSAGVEEACAELGLSLDAAVYDRSDGLLTTEDLRELERAVDLFSLDLFRELSFYCQATYGIRPFLIFRPADRSVMEEGTMAYTSFNPDQGLIFFCFYLFPEHSPYRGQGTSAGTCLHEFTHLLHMVLEDRGLGGDLKDALYRLNEGFPYEEDYLAEVVRQYQGHLDPGMTEEELYAFLLEHPELLYLYPAWEAYLDQRWDSFAQYRFWTPYGATDCYEDVATILESTAGTVSVLDMEGDPDCAPLLQKYAAITAAFRSHFAGADDAPFLSGLDEDLPAPWADPYLARARSLGLMEDWLDGAYDREITRLEFCRLAVDLLEAVWGEDPAAHLARAGIPVTDRFSDVDDGDVDVMAALGVVSGRGGGLFDPNAPIRRDEAAKMLAFTASAVGGDGVFEGLRASKAYSDSSAFPAWARVPIAQLSSAGIMNGMGAGFVPGGSYTRQQSVTTMVRLYELLAA